jgi:hypothetical protein
MGISNRELAAGMVFVARYKKVEHRVLVLGDKDAGFGFELDNDKIFKSLSSAGSAIMGGTACNGWRFFTPEGELPEAKVPSEPTPTAKAAKTRKVKLIRKMKVQTEVPEGQVKYFCSGCQGAFLHASGEEPTHCPEGHAADQQDDLAPVDSTEA